VRNAAQFLKLKTIPDEMRRPIEMIDRQVSQMARLIDDLLDVSRITRGVVPLRLEYVDWAEIVQAVMITCEAEIQARRHSLRVSWPPQPVTLWADRQRLIQVFSNLISNAAKYTPAGGRIDFSAQPEHGRLEVVVRDNGIGIPPEKLSEVFELFAQVDRSLERQGGLGIGLTLARQLIELHHGTIEAHSDGVGRGSSFAVRLPIAEAAPLAPVATDGSGSQTAASSRRILVVDDNQDAAESLALFLGMSGHEAKSFTDGHEALEAGSALRPDLAFVDIGMPRMNGYELARRIRGTRWGRRVFLVALTGWGQEADRLRSHEAGFDAHMVKPPSPEALAALLQAIGVPREQEPAR
jgi:CheY-like chemotaxis protein